jgi:hypothetical protein
MLPARRPAALAAGRGFSLVRADFPPEIGPITEDEVRLIDAALPSIALGDGTPLLETLQAILHHRCSPDQWAYYESLPPELQHEVLDRVRMQIPMIGPGAP